jgi:hypothetical protein
MLPFLKNKLEATSGSTSEPIKREHDETFEYDGLETAMEELGQHLKNSNWKAAAECFKAAIQMASGDEHE